MSLTTVPTDIKRRDHFYNGEYTVSVTIMIQFSAWGTYLLLVP